MKQHVVGDGNTQVSIQIFPGTSKKNRNAPGAVRRYEQGAALLVLSAVANLASEFNRFSDHKDIISLLVLSLMSMGCLFFFFAWLRQKDGCKARV